MHNLVELLQVDNLKIIIIPLAVLVFIMILAQAHAHMQFNFLNSVTTESGDISGSQTQNGTSTEYSQPTQGAIFSPDLANGIIAIVIALSGILAVVGIRVVGSGISETSVMIIYKTIFFYVLWGVCSVFALDNREGLLSIPNNIGLYLWFGFTLFYSIGIVQSVGVISGGQ